MRSKSLAGAAAVALVAVLAAPSARAAPAREERAGSEAPAPLQPAQQAKRVLIVSIDGLGPEVLRQSVVTHMRALMARGASTLSALTTETVKTLPSHVSMLTGVRPEEHGIAWNDAFRGYPRVPTLFEWAKRHRPGLTTALVAGKAKFQTFLRGGLDWSFVPSDDDVADDQVAERAAALVREHAPDLLFVHLPNVDQEGHAHGWGSPQQRAAAARADQAVGRIEDALRERGLLDETVVIVTADHGGLGRNHVPGDGVSRRIPWILDGPGVRRGVDLAKAGGPHVHVEDTFATASWLLGLPLPSGIDGRPLTSAVKLAGERP